MKFEPIPCHESLRPFIRNYWLLTAHATATGMQQVFSNGAASLHFYLSQPVRVRVAMSDDDDGRFYHTLLYHQNMESVGVVCEEGPFLIFGAEFVPFCSRLFFPSEKIDEKSGAVFVTPERLGDEDFVEMARKIHAAASTEERVELLDDFFMQRLAALPADDVNIERLSDVFDEIVPTDGSVARPPQFKDDFSPADLASTACLSQKQFTRVFNKYVGMNPKAYLRLLRFHKALQTLQSSASSLTDVACRCGYYDLAHMTSDFRDICGYSPSELLAANSGLTETFQPGFSGLMKKKIKIENLE